MQFTVGSLNEPIAVDDKTGVHLKVVEAEAPSGGSAETEEHHGEGGAIVGLDKTLKVEISAGDKKKTMDLAPIHGDAGTYRASFIPTIQTTYTYRFFGTVNEKPIDVYFTCNPAGHPASPEDTNAVKLNEDVTQLKKTGAFGCPVAKAELGFPEAAMSEYDIVSKVNASDMALADLGLTSRNFTMLAMAIGGLALILAIGGLMKSRSGGSEMP